MNELVAYVLEQKYKRKVGRQEMTFNTPLTSPYRYEQVLQG